MPTDSGSAAQERLAQRLVRELAVARSAEAAIDAVLRVVALEHGCSLAALWSLDVATGALRLRRDWASGNATDELRRVARRLTFPAGVGMLGAVVESGEAAVLEDLAEAPDFPRRELALEAGLRSATAVPLASTEGPIGVIEFFSAEPGAPPEKLADVEGAARQLAPYLARLQIEDRLRVSEEESASITHAALDCIITMDHRGRVLGFNPAAEATFGYTREQAVGRPLADLIIPPELREAHQRALAAHVQTGRPTILNRRLELTGLRADGSTLPVELTVTRLGTREPPVYAGFIRDIGEQQRASARLAFLSSAGRKMAESMDWQETLRAIVREAVPTIADGALLTVIEAGGRPRVAAAAPADPAPPGRPDAATLRVIESGQLELAEDGRLLAAPLRAPAGVTGALTLTRAAASPPFEHDDVELVTSFAARASLHVQNSRLYTERSHIARTLQASLRPQALPPVEGADVAVRYLPAGEHNEVGGDFYDLYRTGADAWGAMVGDVSGKGAEAAAVTAMARHTLRTAAMLHDEPGEIVDVLNRAMIAQAVPAFCTVIYARLRPSSGAGLDVDYANGGHPAPVVLRAGGELEWLDAGRGPLVGALEDASFGQGFLRLHPGDLLLLYTDGVTEVRTSEPELGERELAATLARCRGASAVEVVGAVEERAVAIQDGRPRDDIAVLAIRAL